MKVGIKAYRYVRGIENLVKSADFIEVMALRNNNYSFFKQLHLPIVIHAQHEFFGINNADFLLMDKNLDALNYARSVADYLDSEKIVVHPGVIRNDGCSFNNSIKILRAFGDSRVIVENMPKRDYLCSTYVDTRDFLKSFKGGLCFDISHAIETTFSGACQGNFSYLGVLKDYLRLRPEHYHLGGQKINGSSHLAFEDSEVNLKEIFSILPIDAQITLETSNDLKKTFEDIKIIREIIASLEKKVVSE